MDTKTFGLVFVVFWSTVQCQDEAFGGGGEPIIATDGKKCNTIEGTLEGCAECYPCAHGFVLAATQAGRGVARLTLYNSTCIGNEVCCVRSLDAIGIGSRIGVECGTPGLSYGKKENRDFGEKELPWMGFVYSSSKGKFVCAATLIEDLLLVTSASCVQDLSSSDMKVSFNYKPAANNNMYSVETVLTHKDFDKRTYSNDIALVKLKRASIPQWVKPACLPDDKLKQGTMCTTISQTKYYKFQSITSKATCSSKKVCTSPSPLHKKEVPWAGAGLYCETPATKQLTYAVYGVYATKNQYTSTVKYSDWIEDNKNI